MNDRQSDFHQQTPIGHIYVNGYGFVNTDPRIQEERGIRKNAAATGLALVEIFLLSAFCPYAVTLFLNGLLAIVPLNGSYELTFLLVELRETLSYLLSLGIPLVITYLLLKPGRGSISLRKLPADYSLFSISIISSLAVMVLMNIMTSCIERIFAGFHILELTPDYLLPSTPMALLLYTIRLALLPAILEEFLFRGVLLRSLRQYGDAFALMASSIAFGLIHYSLTRDLSGFVMGLVLGYFVIRTGSVFTAVCSRFLTLLVPLIMRFLQHIAPYPLYRFTEYALYCLILAAAIGVFILICRREGNAFILSSGNTQTRISRKLRIYLLSFPMVIAGVLWLAQIFRHVHFIG